MPLLRRYTYTYMQHTLTSAFYSNIFAKTHAAARPNQSAEARQLLARRLAASTVGQTPAGNALNKQNNALLRHVCMCVCVALVAVTIAAATTTSDSTSMTTGENIYILISVYVCAMASVRHFPTSWPRYAEISTLPCFCFFLRLTIFPLIFCSLILMLSACIQQSIVSARSPA